MEQHRFSCKRGVTTYTKKGKYTQHAQGKMTNTMTMQEQIEMSGLEIMSSLSSSSSSSLSSQLQWNSTNQWSPLLGGGRESQACVTIESGNENGAGGQTIVVIGGTMQSDSYTNSVIVWDPSTKRWRNGPSLNDRRRDLVAVVCRGKVYAIGGDNNNTTLDTFDSIQVSSVLEMTERTTTTRQNNNQWTRLQCRLSSPRLHCAAVTIHNCYIIILGGVNVMGQPLSSVDIMDTAPPHNNNNNNSNGEPTIVAGPSMNFARLLLEQLWWTIRYLWWVDGSIVSDQPQWNLSCSRSSHRTRTREIATAI